MCKPPFTEKSAPVAKAASSEASQATMEAISSGVPRRPTGIVATIFWAVFWVAFWVVSWVLSRPSSREPSCTSRARKVTIRNPCRSSKSGGAGLLGSEVAYTLAWQPEDAASGYNVYRGLLSTRSGTNYGSCWRASTLRDADLDGLLDLLVVNGHIDDTVRQIRRDVSYDQPPHLFLNQGPAGFRDVAREAGGEFRVHHFVTNERRNLIALGL